MLPQIEITLLVIEALERLKIPYMVAGSLAVAAHGVARGTRDADLVAALGPGDARRLRTELGGAFYLDEETAEEAIRRQTCLNAIHIPEAFKVDIFVLGPGAYDQEAFRRRVRMPFGLDPSRPAFLQTPEDTVLAKLKWYRLGGEVSDVQWRDVLGLLKLQQGLLDMDYVRRWAVAEGVLDLLERALSESAKSVQ